MFFSNLTLQCSKNLRDKMMLPNVHKSFTSRLPINFFIVLEDNPYVIYDQLDK